MSGNSCISNNNINNSSIGATHLAKWHKNVFVSIQRNNLQFIMYTEILLLQTVMAQTTKTDHITFMSSL